MNTQSLPALDGRVCLITGGTSGLGEATAVGLVKLGAEVYIHGPDEASCVAAQGRIRAATGRDVGLFDADLSDLDEVRALAREINARLPKLHILIHNAGVLHSRHGLSAQGYERTLAVNYLAPYLLTRLLLQRLQESGTARIINVISEASYRRAALDLAALDPHTQADPRRFKGWLAYRRSKVALLLFSRALARRLEADGTGLTVNCVDPGPIRTRFVSRSEGLIGLYLKLLRLLADPPERAADALLYLAACGQIANTTGALFVQRRPRRASKIADDELLSQKLWALSEALCGLEDEALADAS
ncbi:SDR family NAD(P)-dependent oxidoreductase [Myxococcota bacterium]|nr:SDR family NAD(P)-dependent oxidoreductase [Myxococcota bacterium]MBU1429351.1 SDR family NAD(P)-dependent oxidoreductase [Myxococcota bacterium]MBU1899591.1 SDR family NAD(P)-dependent oxidoreductase [Myxococcota bacterium]